MRGRRNQGDGVRVWTKSPVSEEQTYGKKNPQKHSHGVTHRERHTRTHVHTVLIGTTCCQTLGIMGNSNLFSCFVALGRGVGEMAGVEGIRDWR